jgi:chitodextrinase
MAKNRKATRRGRQGRTQADEVMELIREGTAVQVELLGAAARVWSDIVERVANYNRELTNQLLEFSAGKTNANDSLDLLVKAGKRHVEGFRELPGKIGKDFERNARQRARMGHPAE